MIDRQRTKLAKNRKVAIARFLVAMLMFGGLVMQPRLTEKVKAQTECRTVAPQSIQNILSATVIRTGFNTYRVILRTKSPFAVFCNFVSCNQDKFTYKPLISTNIAGISGGGCSGEFFITTPPSGNYYQFIFGFKVRFRDLSTGQPGIGTPLRKTAQLLGDFPPCPPGESCASEEEIDVTHLLVDAPDDGTDG